MLNQVLNVANNAINAYDKLTEYPTPIFRVEVDGVDISPQMATRLMSLTVKDNFAALRFDQAQQRPPGSGFTAARLAHQR